MRLSTDRVQPQNVTGDCNSNGTADWLDIVANFNLDLNGNWIIDTCENSANPAVIASIRVPDETAGDSEEAGMLFAGASNMLTTRSDTFTVYFRIRSFRQNLSVNPPVWDATNPEYIIDDSRYVMLVDRSLVNKPGDKPRILYLEKLPH